MLHYSTFLVLLLFIGGLLWHSIVIVDKWKSKDLSPSIASLEMIKDEEALNAPYFVDRHDGWNNVYESTNTPYVRFLGLFQSTNECIESCIAGNTANNRCESYSYFVLNHQCFGRFGSKYGVLWTPVLDQEVDSGRVIYRCTSDLDCQFNGKCNLNTGNCSCYKAWSGVHCQSLNVLPATKGHGYHLLEDGDLKRPTSSWGGSVLMDRQSDDNKTKYHMFVSEFDNHCGVNSWNLNSRVTHAQSTNGYDSPYRRLRVHHPHFAHEVNAIHGPDGEVVLYYSAWNYRNVAECECDDGSTDPDKCKMSGEDYNFLNIMDYSASGSMDGPWTQTVIFPNKTSLSRDTNLNGVILDNGTFVGMMRLVTPKGSEMHSVIGGHWKDGSSYIMNTDVMFPHLVQWLTEDPFIYRDCNGYFHAIFHNQSPANLPILCGGHSYSTDGVNWIYGGTSYSNKVQFQDGSELAFSRRERPHFVLGDDGCTPMALTTGSQYGGRFGDATYTSLQPIAH